MSRLVDRLFLVAGAATLTLAINPALAQNVGSASDLAAIASAIHEDGSQSDKIIQIVVVGQYAVAEVHREGESQVSTEAYTQRGNKLRPQRPGWHLVGAISTVPAPCWLQQYGYPKAVADQIAAHIPAMSHVEQTNPRYECD